MKFGSGEKRLKAQFSANFIKIKKKMNFFEFNV